MSNWMNTKTCICMCAKDCYPRKKMSVAHTFYWLHFILSIKYGVKSFAQNTLSTHCDDRKLEILVAIECPFSSSNNHWWNTIRALWKAWGNILLRVTIILCITPILFFCWSKTIPGLRTPKPWADFTGKPKFTACVLPEVGSSGTR